MDKLIYRDEAPASLYPIREPARPRVKVIVADDEPEVHRVTRFALNSFHFDGSGLEILDAYSASEAFDLVAANPDAAVLLLDVVMESENAGLDIVRRIRNELGNRMLRIVLRTGQPGKAPEAEVISQYDINDYREKTEMTGQRLATVMHSCIRAARDIAMIEASNRGLEKIIQANAAVFRVQSLEPFANGLLATLCEFLQAPPDVGALAAVGVDDALVVIAATGPLLGSIGAKLSQTLPPEAWRAVRERLAAKASGRIGEGYLGVYPGSNEVILAYVGRSSDTLALNENLLEIFSRNISLGFENIRLREEIEAKQRQAVEQELGEYRRSLSAVLATTRLGVWFLDNDATTTDLNPAMAAILGRPREEILGKDIYSFVDAENAKIFRRELGKRAQGGNDAYEIALSRPDGSTVPCLNSPAPIYDAQGVKSGSVGIWADISDMKERERQLVVAQAKAEAANNAKADFLAHMSHELRTPLNAILGYSEVIRDKMFGDADARYANYAGIVHSSGSHLLSLVDDLLDLAKIDADRHELVEEDVPIDTLIDLVMTMIGPRAEGQGVTLHRQISAGGVVRGDLRGLSQVLINLVTNGVKFTSRGGEVRLTALVDAGPALRIEVQDTGVGMEPDEILSAFEPFRRGASTITRQAEGVGLGLTISRRLIDLHGGDIAIRSAPGAGTTVIVTLPSARCEGLIAI